MHENNTIIQFAKNLFKRELSADELQRIRDSFQRKAIKKKTLIFMNGDTDTRHYFVAKGLLRMYILHPAGKEYNILFAGENQVIGDLASPEPTRFNLETIEESIVYSVDNHKLQQLSADFTISGSGSADYLIRSYIFLQKRLVSILSKSAEENYQELCSSYPELIQRLPQYHIASYLGVSAEFLNKIIAKARKKK